MDDGDNTPPSPPNKVLFQIHETPQPPSEQVIRDVAAIRSGEEVEKYFRLAGGRIVNDEVIHAREVVRVLLDGALGTKINGILNELSKHYVQLGNLILAEEPSPFKGFQSSVSLQNEGEYETAEDARPELAQSHGMLKAMANKLNNDGIKTQLNDDPVERPGFFTETWWVHTLEVDPLQENFIPNLIAALHYQRLQEAKTNMGASGAASATELSRRIADQIRRDLWADIEKPSPGK